MVLPSRLVEQSLAWWTGLSHSLQLAFGSSLQIGHKAALQMMAFAFGGTLAAVVDRLLTLAACRFRHGGVNNNNNQQPTTNNQQPTTNNQQPTPAKRITNNSSSNLKHLYDTLRFMFCLLFESYLQRTGKEPTSI